MTKELQEAINNIRDLSPKLNEATDEANAIIARVEQFLNDECSIGLRASVHVSDFVLSETKNRTCSRCTYLVYDRVDGKFRIAVETYQTTYNSRIQEQEYGPGEVIAWSFCPRSVKLETFTKLPELLAAIAEQAGKATESAQKAAESVKQILNSMPPVVPNPDARD